MFPYPTEQEIAQLVSHLSTDDFQPFYNRVVQDVIWDVPGSSSGSGYFTSLEQWRKNALEKTNSVLSRPLKFKLVHVTGGGDQAWAAVELEAVDAVGKNGMPYPQKYCWVMRFNEQGAIAQVRVYADTQLSQTIIEANT